MLSQSTIESVKDLPIEDVIANYISIKKKGADYTACCPFHNEKSPSFFISPAKGIYKCFGCGKSGDGIRFVEEYQTLSFPEAVKEIASAHSIFVQEDKPSAEFEAQRKKNDDYATVTRGALGHYTKALHERPELLRSILAERRISWATLIDFQIGYAPDEWKFLTTRIIEKGFYTPAAALGLIKRKKEATGEDAESNYDFFRHRVMIPIIDRNGVCIGFGGRKFADGDEDNPKYLNSSETKGFFDKGKTLFGVNLTGKQIRKAEEAYLVEGYWDVISLYDKNIFNVVATMGTAFTEDQAKRLGKLCDSVVLMRDGDKAGYKSTVQGIQMALEHGITPSVLELPEGMDPDSWARWVEWMSWDTYNDLPGLGADNLREWCEVDRKEGVDWFIDHQMANAKTVTERSEATELICRVLANVPNDFSRTEYMERAQRVYKLNKTTFNSRIKNIIEERKEELESRPAEDQLPPWVVKDTLYATGFVMNFNKDKDKVGIYWQADGIHRIKRLTNYTIKPLYLVNDSTNSRRLIEVHNGMRTSMVELPSKAFISQDMFETEIVSKGAYYSENGFGKPHFKQLANWLMDNMPVVFELKTLGWQSEGFFAFSNKCIAVKYSDNEYKGTEVLNFDEYGIVQVDDKKFLSSGRSKMNQDYRQEDNVYENDLYLTHVKSPIEFEEWASIFCKVYDEHAPFGIAFIFISAFKDIVTRVTKCPHMYFYGPKGSGKSAIAESIMWFFFSGKNSEGKLIQGYNLNPGQGTPFSFFSRMQRFRNVAMLFNEYDPNAVEQWKKGALKAAYDGEGREIGSGDTGKKRKTEIQKTQCTLLIAGQYLDTTDDGAVLSRSIVCKFSLEKNKNRTDEQKREWARLNDFESHGISSLAAEIYKFRDTVSKQLKEEFWKVQSELNTELRRSGRNVEIRLLSNYSLSIAMINIMSPLVTLPFKAEAFRTMAMDRIKEQAATLKENNMLNTFWKAMENLFDDGMLRHNIHFKLSSTDKVSLKKDSQTFKKDLGEVTDIIYVRFNLIYDKFAKRFRETHNKTAPDQDTLITYLKDQPYYIGMCPSTWFEDKSTNAFVLNYELLEIKLEKDGSTPAGDLKIPDHDTDTPPPPVDDKDLPF